MDQNVGDFEAFYQAPLGRVTSDLISEHLKAIWPDISGKLLGFGYVFPFLKALEKEAVIYMPSDQGACHWPAPPAQNRVVTGLSEQLPFENAGFDYVLMAHNLEFEQDPGTVLEQVFRVLKAEGRLLMIVPNRAGLWAHAEHTPFGHGTPYSRAQLLRFTKQIPFICTRQEEALLMPPFEQKAFLKMSGFCESVGRFCFPLAAGVHIVEFQKKLYAGLKGGGVQRTRNEHGGLVPSLSS